MAWLVEPILWVAEAEALLFKAAAASLESFVHCQHLGALPTEQKTFDESEHCAVISLALPLPCELLVDVRVEADAECARGAVLRLRHRGSQGSLKVALAPCACGYTAVSTVSLSYAPHAVKNAPVLTSKLQRFAERR